MALPTNISTSRNAQRSQMWCVVSKGTQENGLRRLDSQKHALPTSIFAYANPEVGT